MSLLNDAWNLAKNVILSYATAGIAGSGAGMGLGMLAGDVVGAVIGGVIGATIGTLAGVPIIRAIDEVLTDSRE